MKKRLKARKKRRNRSRGSRPAAPRRSRRVRLNVLPADKWAEVRRGVTVYDALAGAQMALLSRKQWRRASEIVDQVEHLELSTQPRFMEAFVRAMDFPPLPPQQDGEAGVPRAGPA